MNFYILLTTAGLKYYFLQYKIYYCSKGQTVHIYALMSIIFHYIGSKSRSLEAEMAAIISNEENCHCDEFTIDFKDPDDIFDDNKLNFGDIEDGKNGKKKKKKNKKNKNNVHQNKNIDGQQEDIKSEDEEEDEMINEKEVDEELKCPRCQKMFDTPLLLPCMHFFCLK